MRIDRVDLFALAMPLRGDFATSFARVTEREMVIVALHADGLTGWGEAPVAARPHYSAETAATALHVLADWLAPAIVGRDLAALDDLERAMAFVRGHHMARAALGFAFLDLLGQARGVPLARLLGGAAERVPVGVSLGIPAGGADALVDAVAARVAEGYARVKAKVEPGFAAEPLAKVRARFPALRLAADANGAFTYDRHARDLHALDDLGLIYLEQPLAPYDLAGHGRLRRALRTPLCLDESVEGLDDLDAALRLGALSILNLKPGRVGGPARALAIVERCRRLEVPLWCGGMLETGIGRAACVALASVPGFTLEADLSASDRYYAEDLVEPPFRIGAGSTLAVPTGPGLGVHVQRDRLARATRAHRTIGPALTRG